MATMPVILVTCLCRTCYFFPSGGLSHCQYSLCLQTERWSKTELVWVVRSNRCYIYQQSPISVLTQLGIEQLRWCDTRCCHYGRLSQCTMVSMNLANVYWYCRVERSPGGNAGREIQGTAAETEAGSVECETKLPDLRLGTRTRNSKATKAALRGSRRIVGNRICRRRQQCLRLGNNPAFWDCHSADLSLLAVSANIWDKHNHASKLLPYLCEVEPTPNTVVSIITHVRFGGIFNNSKVIGKGVATFFLPTVYISSFTTSC